MIKKIKKIMTQEEQIEGVEGVIQSLAKVLRTTPFSVEFKVVKKPKGIKIIHEVTQEQLNMIMERARKKSEEE